MIAAPAPAPVPDACFAPRPSRALRFVHRGAIVDVADPDPTRTVLEWLREDRRATGTKEGCAEGDCGACVVAVGRLRDRGARPRADRAEDHDRCARAGVDPSAVAGGDAGVTTAGDSADTATRAEDDDAIVWRPVNACIALLPSLDGAALVTVEDLAAADGTLHPVQQALVDAHASQCGFCTPGFVMTLWTALQRRGSRDAPPPTRDEVADALAGNLCRCTGYRPIVDAAAAVLGGRAGVVPRSEAAAIAAQLRELRGDAPLRLPRWSAPRSLADFAAQRERLPQARIVGGATDIALEVTKRLRDPGPLLAIGRVAELQRIDVDGERIAIGGAVTLDDAWSTLAARWPALADVGRRFAGPPVRHAGTFVGNVANGSPIGDAAPVLLALAAALVLKRGECERRLPLDDFMTGYRTNRLDAGEFVAAVEVPLPHAGQVVRAYKVGKRHDSDISAVCAGFALTLADGCVAAARLAYGGLAATVHRAAAAEAALVGRPWDEAALAAAQAALAADYAPLSDLRASAGYRLQVARALLRRLWLQTRAADPLTDAQTSVFAPGVGATA